MSTNLYSGTVIYGKTSFLNLGITTSTIVSNGLATFKSIRINSLIISNITAAGDVEEVYVQINNGGVTSYLAYKIPVPGYSSLVVVSKDTPLYLLDNDSYISAWSSQSNALTATCSYEECS